MSTKEYLLTLTRSKLSIGGDIVAMKEGGVGAVVGVIMIHVSIGVNDIVTDDGLSSITLGNEYTFVFPKETVWGTGADKKMGTVLGGGDGVEPFIYLLSL